MTLFSVGGQWLLLQLPMSPRPVMRMRSDVLGLCKRLRLYLFFSCPAGLLCNTAVIFTCFSEREMLCMHAAILQHTCQCCNAHRQEMLATQKRHECFERCSSGLVSEVKPAPVGKQILRLCMYARVLWGPRGCTGWCMLGSGWSGSRGCREERSCSLSAHQPRFRCAHTAVTVSVLTPPSDDIM